MSVTLHNGLKSWSRTIVMASLAVMVASFFILATTPAKASQLYAVSISDNTATLFSPQNVTVNVGDTVTWTCIDGAHTVTSNSGQVEYFSSPTLTEGGTFSWTFTHPGTISYGSSASTDTGQVGYIIVQQPSPEFPGYALYITVAAAVILGLLVERRLRA